MWSVSSSVRVKCFRCFCLFPEVILLVLAFVAVDCSTSSSLLMRSYISDFNTIQFSSFTYLGGIVFKFTASNYLTFYIDLLQPCELLLVTFRKDCARTLSNSLGIDKSVLTRSQIPQNQCCINLASIIWKVIESSRISQIDTVFC